MRVAYVGPVRNYLFIVLTCWALIATLPGRAQTTDSSSANTSDKQKIETLQSQVNDLQTKLRLIGAALQMSGGTAAPSTEAAPVAAPVAQPVSAPAAGTSPDVSALQAQLADLTSKYETLMATVNQQGGQIAPLHDQLDQLNKTVQDKMSAPAPAAGAPASAPAAAPTGTPAAPPAPDLSVNINISWTLITGYLVMFMQAGFALVETGFTRAKNAAHTMAMNMMVYVLGMLGYWVSGFALQYGGNGDPNSVTPVTTLGDAASKVLNHEIGLNLAGHWFGLWGAKGFFLHGQAFEGGIFTLFLFEMVFMDTAATIPTGAMAERWKFLPFCIFSFCVGAFIYPTFGNWVWGGGWLAAMGQNFHLGHGHVDFAGSSVVHMQGGMLALAGAMMLGPRIGKYNADGTPNPIPGHNLPMAILGTFILAFGWFGFNPGSTLASTDIRIGIIATNTMLASASGAVMAMIICWWRIGKPDPAFMCNGMLAGLVAITAPCAFVDSWAAVVLGAIAGWVMYVSVFFVEEKLKIDDPVGAISVHGTAGAWGVISLGIFANGTYSEGWNNVKGNVTGALYGDTSQLVAECIGVAVCFVTDFALAWAVLWVIEKTIGNRVTAEAELEGLDIPEMGTLGYNNDV
jgi:Amt family ammonium transporter